MTIILIVVIVVLLLRRLTDYITQATLLWWMGENDCPYPSTEDMNRGRKWVSEHMAKDILKGIRK